MRPASHGQPICPPPGDCAALCGGPFQIEFDENGCGFCQCFVAKQPVRVAFSNVSVQEGGIGTTTKASFTISLAEPVTDGEISISYQTADGDAEPKATAGEDYEAASGQVKFAPGETSKSVEVTVNGDLTPEQDEEFRLLAEGYGTTSPTRYPVIDSSTYPGFGTIVNDDGVPPAVVAFTIGDVEVVEGHAGTRLAHFTVSRPEPGLPASIDFTTEPRTATAGRDYQPVSGTLEFAPTETSKTLSVPIIGDTEDEPDERFAVKLSARGAVTFADAEGLGTIRDDDPPGAPGDDADEDRPERRVDERDTDEERGDRREGEGRPGLGGARPTEQGGETVGDELPFTGLAVLALAVVGTFLLVVGTRVRRR